MSNVKGTWDRTRSNVMPNYLICNIRPDGINNSNNCIQLPLYWPKWDIMRQDMEVADQVHHKFSIAKSVRSCKDSQLSWHSPPFWNFVLRSDNDLGLLTSQAIWTYLNRCSLYRMFELSWMKEPVESQLRSLKTRELNGAEFCCCKKHQTEGGEKEHTKLAGSTFLGQRVMWQLVGNFPLGCVFDHVCFPCYQMLLVAQLLNLTAFLPSKLQSHQSPQTFVLTKLGSHMM